jgi:HSP20 family protein
MTLARLHNHRGWFDPFQGFAPLVNELFTPAPGTPTWAPPVDVSESPEGVELVADLPGIALEAINISVEKGELTIRAERTAPTPAEKTCTCTAERPYGVFERTFTLGEQLDPEKIEARYEAGVLHVTVAKKPQAQPRRIQVAVKS